VIREALARLLGAPLERAAAEGTADAIVILGAPLAKDGLLTDVLREVRVIRLSRNFGKEAALLAGLTNARGDAVITMDADLQHPPSLIPQMVQAWEHGAIVVHGVKRNRGDEPWWVSARAAVVNSILSRLGRIDMHGSSDFKVLDRRAVDVLVQHVPERHRFFRGLTQWMGFPQVTIEFDVAEREQGTSRFSLRALIALALTALLSFTSLPLRVVSILGVLTFVLAGVIGTEALWSWIHGSTVSGFATVIGTLLLTGSVIMFSLGVIGEYIARIYDEIKHRPAFIIDRQYEYKSRGMEEPRSAVWESPTETTN
jgi:glycosyltransferase involved in cell wall biosynthesis